VSRTGDRCAPFGVAPPNAGNRSRFRLRLATMRRIGEIRRANFLEQRSGPRRGLRGTQRLHFHDEGVSRPIGTALPQRSRRAEKKDYTDDTELTKPSERQNLRHLRAFGGEELIMTPVECLDCEKHGMFGTGNGKCFACHGTGQQLRDGVMDGVLRRDYQRCRICGGSGICATCNGKGNLTHPPPKWRKERSGC
jgi:hypothetical protein